jgi:hypothetical protein
MDKETESVDALYALARDVAGKARTVGEPEAAEVIEAALLKGGSTASEQLGEIGIAFRTIRERAKRWLPKSMADRLSDAIRAIDEAFERANESRL